MSLHPFKIVSSLRMSMGASSRSINRGAGRSRQFISKKFRNAQATKNMSIGDIVTLLKDAITKKRTGLPKITIPLQHTNNDSKEDLAVTWYGHASVLIEIAGQRILADPMWSERASPVSFVGPKRLHAVPTALALLKNIDAVIISHDHYDHLDMATIVYIAAHMTSLFIVPIGVGAHLVKWGIAEDRIVELDWDEQYQLGKAKLICAEAQHFSGRSLKRDTTLWSSWVIESQKHRVFFGGDTGYTSSFKKIGEKYGLFDITLLPIGAYDKGWAPIHLDPEEAVQTHKDLRGDMFIPIHWATFNLAFHSWSEPVERLLVAANKQAIKLVVPQPGQRVIFGRDNSLEMWWRGPFLKDKSKK